MDELQVSRTIRGARDGMATSKMEVGLEVGRMVQRTACATTRNESK